MNKILFLSLIFCSSLVKAQDFSVVLGKGDDCSGFNICSFVKGTQETDEQINIKIEKKGRRLKIIFLKEGMHDKYFVQYFLKEYFLIDEDFELPQGVCKAIGIDSYTIEQGKYDIKDLGKSIEVLF